MTYLGEYGVALTIYFPLIKRAVMDFAVSADYTHASGDVKISQDGGAAATATNAPAAITMGNGAMWSLTLTATEMQAATIAVTIIDATTKAVEDQMIVIQTNMPDILLKRDLSAVTGEAARSMLNALRFLRNKWSISGTTLTVTKEDDTTTAFTSTLTQTAGANPVTASDPS